MSDYIVQEEDGTSRLELEEGTGFLLREEAGGVESSAGFSAEAAVTVLGSEEPAGQARWVVQVLTVPASTGSVAYTGFGATPKAVFFFGTNWTTEDTAVTTTGTGVFRGMAARDYASPSTINNGFAFVSPAGDQHACFGGYCVYADTTAGTHTELYTASATAFGSDGFTLNWSKVPGSGTYKVVAVALMEVANASSFYGTSNQTGLAFGFRSSASLLHGAWNGNIGTGGADRTQEFYGGAAYPPGGPYASAGMSCLCFPGSSSGQYLNNLIIQDPSIIVANSCHFTGPFLVSTNIHAVVTGTGEENLTYAGDSSSGGMIVGWDDCPSDTGTITIPDNASDTSTQSGLPFAPGLVIGYSISDEPGGQGTGSRGAAGFSVVTPDFQWCALVDGQSSRGSYQSFQRGFVDRVSGTSIHAGTIGLTDDGFVMTAVDDDLDTGSWIWHAFGYPTEEQAWIPQIVRYA